jgi:hypothetical protein
MITAELARESALPTLAPPCCAAGITHLGFTALLAGSTGPHRDRAGRVPFMLGWCLMGCGAVGREVGTPASTGVYGDVWLLYWSKLRPSQCLCPDRRDHHHNDLHTTRDLPGDAAR